MSRTSHYVIKAASIPVLAFAFMPLWLLVELNAWLPYVDILINLIYASILTLSLVYFGLKLRDIPSE